MNRGNTHPSRAKENKYLVGSSPPMVTQGADGEDNSIMRRKGLNPRVTTWRREDRAGTPVRIACEPGPSFVMFSCCDRGAFVTAVHLPLLYPPGKAPPTGTQLAPFYLSFSTATEKLMFLKISSELVQLVLLYIYDHKPSRVLLLPDCRSQEVGPHLRRPLLPS